MPEPKRRLWQVHRSTAIMLAIVAAVLLWANTRLPSPYTTSSGWTVTPGRGWPLSNDNYRRGWEIADGLTLSGGALLFLNVGCAMLLIAALGVGGECFSQQVERRGAMALFRLHLSTALAVMLLIGLWMLVDFWFYNTFLHDIDARLYEKPNWFPLAEFLRGICGYALALQTAITAVLMAVLERRWMNEDHAQKEVLLHADKGVLVERRRSGG